MEKLKLNKTLIYVIILIIFVSFGFVTGLHHEPWADEAQSWLLARDTSSFSALLSATRFEGTPPLWHIVLKLFYICGLDYNHIYIVPLFSPQLVFFCFYFLLTLRLGLRLFCHFHILCFIRIRLLQEAIALFFRY